MEATQARASMLDRSDDGPSADPVDPDPDQPRPPAADRPTLEVLDPSGRLSRSESETLRTLGERALAEIRPRDNAGGEVRARIVGDAEMAALHLSTLGDPTTTDVLTFDLTGARTGETPVPLREGDRTGETPVPPVEPDRTGETPAPLDVDVVLCADQAARAAAAVGVPVEHELLLYLIHGVLHCCGYDDRTDADARAMHDREDEILRAIGVGPIFEREAPAAGDTP